MKKKTMSLLALLLAFSMAFSPLSYMKAYAAEPEQAVESASDEEETKEPEAEASGEEKKESAEAPENSAAEESTEALESTEAESTEASESSAEESTEASESSAEESTEALESTEAESTEVSGETGAVPESSKAETEAAAAETKAPAKAEAAEKAEAEEIKKAEADTVNAAQAAGQIALQAEGIMPLADGDDGYEATGGIKAVYADDDAKKPGQDYTMLKIGESMAVVKGDQIEVTIWIKPNSKGKYTYDAIYIGNKNDDPKEPVVLGEVDTAKSLQKYTFMVPYSAKGTSVNFVPRSASKGTWSTNSSLALTIPSTFSAPAAFTITSQPEAETIEMAGAPVTLSIGVEGENLTYLWQFSADGATWTDCTGAGAATTEYQFTMAADTAGQYRCVVTDANGKSKTSDTATVREPVTPILTGDKVQVVKEDKTEFKMFAILDSSVTADGENLDIEFTTKKDNSYNRIYLGPKSDADKTPVYTALEEADAKRYTFSVPASCKGTAIPVSLGYPEGSGKDWYVKQYLWLYIPDEGIKELPTVTDGIETVQGGTGSPYNDFRIVSSKAVLKGDQVLLTLNVNGNKWTKLYQGVQSDGNKTPAYNGTYDAAAGTTAFTFAVPAEKQGMYLPVTPGNASGWFSYARDLFIKIPELEAKAGTTADGVYDLYGSAFPIGNYASLGFERESKVAIKGDTATVTLVTQAASYDKLYIGSVSDADSAKDAGAVTAVARTDIGAAYKSFTFTIPTADLGKEIGYVVHIEGSDSWAEKQSSFRINGILEKTGELPGEKPDEPDPGPTPGTEVPADGTYRVPVESSSSMFKVEDCVLTVKDGKMSAVVTLGGTGYDYLYPGTAAEAGAADSSAWAPYKENADGKYTYTIPVEALDQEVPVAAHSIKRDKWYDRALTFKSEGMEKITPVLEDGVYSVEVESSASMFKVVDCVLTVKDGKMSAVVTLNGTGYDYLYPGTAAEAGAADSSAWAPYKENADGKYTYTIPVEALDQEIPVAAHSIKRNSWYDRLLTFKSDTLKKIADVPGSPDPTTPANPTKPTDPETNIPDNDGKADDESQYESDTSGATSRVDSSTTLADGVYKPDRFTWSGGTGKVRITCNKITVKGGQAYATLVFSSDSYQYVKANGNTYYTSKGGGKATVVVPVALNKNNRILGMTTKMSATHEIEYSIFIYLAAAGNGQALGENSNEKLDEEAPELMGLEYQSETKLDYAEYFKIYHYDQGIVLLEVDMTRDTARDPEKLAGENGEAAEDKKETEEKEEKKEEPETAEEGVILEEGEEEAVASQNEIAAELYKGNVVKYLLVPEDVEVPVGLEQDMIIVNLPLDKTYAASDEILKTMEELELLDVLAAAGCEQKDCEVKAVAEKMEEKEGTTDKEKEADVIFGGLFDDPDFKALIKKEINLALMPGELLPREEEEEAEGGQPAVLKTEAGEQEEEKLTVEEQTKRLEKLTEKFAMFGIPVVVDRSADEKTDLAKYEWIKVYGVLFGCEEEMDELFETAVKEAEQENENQ